MGYILSNIKKISKWRWILITIFLFGASIDTYYHLVLSGTQPSFFEVLVIQTDRASKFTFYFILLLIIADLGYKNNYQIEHDKGIFKYILDIYRYIAFLCFIFILLFFIENILCLLLKEGYINLDNEWRTMTIYGTHRLSPLSAMVASLSLLYLHIFFIAIMVFAINNKCKKRPLGYIGGLAICIIDSTAYYMFNLEKPLGFLPFEHSFLEFVFNYSQNIILDIVINVIYWLILYTILGSIIHFSNKKYDIKN
jgi:hypothetical protein